MRRLEERLEDRHATEEDACARLTAAREEAGRIVHEARDRAEREAAEDRRTVLFRAEREAEQIVSRAKARAEELRRLSAEDRPGAAQEVLALILPRREA